MQKKLETVRGIAAQVAAEDPSKRQRILDGIAECQAARETAARAKEEAETEEELDAALDAERRAMEKERFFKKQLDKLTYTPHMDEATYDRCRESAESVVQESIEQFRRTAERAIADLIAAKEKCDQTAHDAEAVMKELDAVANVLQARFRYREKRFVGMDPYLVEDPNEWKQHVLRYFDNGKLFELATAEDETGNRSLYIAAWDAACRAKLA